ncbi:uncharacterized protein [Centruroides vittatus]|uniref:uncharacterized protein n=1 Tax=Centruroides vittatus TaxID=120091 RepID=UPI00350F4B54
MKILSPGENDNNTEYNEVLIKLINASSHINISGKTIISFIFEDNTMVEYNYKAVVTPTEINGYIGGYSGMWLGLSLIALLDFLDHIFVFFYCIFCSKELRC